MAKHFFFTDQDILNIQLVGQEFGSVATNPTSQYQVTSKHTAAGIPNAYAVSDGVLFVQNAGINLVNLILKPTNQPPFQFPKIKFYVYRSVLKTSLINGIEIAASTSNDLTESIWASQTARNLSAGTNDTPPKEAIGIDIITNGSIDEVFYRDNSSFQLPVVNAGWSLGIFDSPSFGFEIMMENIGFDPELLTVRNSENTIIVNALPSTPTQAQEFEYWHDKEAILNYIDPSAFFGSFYHFKLRVKTSSSTISTKMKNEIYDEILTKYINKNISYLDIRNEYNFSLNYFKNYGTYTNTDINIAFDNLSTLLSRNYYINGWPILRIDNSDFPNNTTNKNIVRIALPDGAGDNPLPTLFISAGYFADQYPIEPKDKNKLIDLTVTAGFTNEVSLIIPNRNSLSGTTAISSYIKLKYFKRFAPNAAVPPFSSGTVIRSKNYLDNLFPTCLNFNTLSYPTLKVKIYEEEVFIDANKNHDYDAIFSLGMVFETNNVTLFANPITFGKNTKYKKNTFSTIGESTLIGQSDTYLGYLSEIENSAELEKIAFVNNSTYTHTLAFTRTTKNLSNFFVPDFNKVLGLTITLLEWDLLVSTANDVSNFNKKYLIYITTENIQYLTDDDGARFTSIEIGLIGYKQISNSLLINQITVLTDIYTNGWNF